MNRFQPLLNWLVTLMVPFFLIMTAIRLLISPVFPEIEYHTPNFPADPYGFTLEDRLYWSKISIDYLINSEPISFLADQQLPDGSSLYNERELRHMLDVKILVQHMLTAWYVLGAALLGLGLWAWAKKWRTQFWLAVSNGGWLTLGLIFAILLGVALSFNALFTDFHRIFFTGDTWLFEYSDSLIRLFPMRFWQDAFIAMGGLTLLGGLLAGVLGRRLAR